jgi:RNA recognition motif-containing protein
MGVIDGPRISVQQSPCQELFKKTVGPLKESFLVYNSQGKSKGMAIVSFQRPGDAVVARTKYDGKIVDGSACSPPPSLFGATQYRSPPVPLMLQDDL